MNEINDYDKIKNFIDEYYDVTNNVRHRTYFTPLFDHYNKINCDNPITSNTFHELLLINNKNFKIKTNGNFVCDYFIKNLKIKKINKKIDKKIDENNNNLVRDFINEYYEITDNIKNFVTLKYLREKYNNINISKQMQLNKFKDALKYNQYNIVIESHKKQYVIINLKNKVSDIDA
jgi:hypothetical protein